MRLSSTMWYGLYDPPTANIHHYHTSNGSARRKSERCLTVLGFKLPEYCLVYSSYAWVSCAISNACLSMPYSRCSGQRYSILVLVSLSGILLKASTTQLMLSLFVRSYAGYIFLLIARNWSFDVVAMLTDEGESHLLWSSACFQIEATKITNWGNSD